MELLTIPVNGFWVTCRHDEDYNEEFGVFQFEKADEYLNKVRSEKPNYEFEMIASIDA